MVNMESGQPLTACKVKKFDQIYFTSSKVNQLEREGVPYPKEFFLAMEAKPEGVRFMGSMGGGTTVGWDEPVIKLVSDQGGEELRRPASVASYKVTGDTNITGSILTRNGLDGLPEDALKAVRKITGGNPGAATAASYFLEESGLDTIQTAADVERILGVSPNMPQSQLRQAQSDLWDRYKNRAR